MWPVPSGNACKHSEAFSHKSAAAPLDPFVLFSLYKPVQVIITLLYDRSLRHCGKHSGLLQSQQNSETNLL